MQLTEKNKVWRNIAMVSLLNITVIVFAIAWLTGFLGYNEDGKIHVLLFIVIFAFLLRILQENKIVVRKYLENFHKSVVLPLLRDNKQREKQNKPTIHFKPVSRWWIF